FHFRQKFQKISYHERAGGWLWHRQYRMVAARRATRVTIIKDGNFATLTLNEALLSQRAPNTPSQRQRFANAPLAAAASQAPERSMAGSLTRGSSPVPSLSLPGGEEITRSHAQGVNPPGPGNPRTDTIDDEAGE